MISQQFSYLQTHYAPFSITFSLRNTTRTINAQWASNGDDYTMKLTLRQGTYSSLNIYFQSNLRDPDGTNSLLLGFCTLPTSGVTASTPVTEYIDDGCNILSTTMPGGTYSNYNLGGTTVHEVGHYLGLLHTFNGYTCSPSDFGDYVADTPQQSASTEGCPAMPIDSCPDSGAPAGWTGIAGQGPNPYGPSGYTGVDPQENFMDYSSDVCYRGFSAGQIARAVNLFGLYREGR